MDSPASNDDYHNIDESSFEVTESKFIKTDQQQPSPININNALKIVNERIMNAYRAGYHDGQENQYQVGFQDGQIFGTAMGFAIGLIVSGVFLSIKSMQKN
jgi:tetrahydromethanopterin S-methyltransferase subunit A